MLTVDRKKTDEGNKLNKVQNKFLSEGKHKEKEDERRKLSKGGQGKRKNTLEVKAVALANRPYGMVAAQPQGATHSVCVCVFVKWRDEYALVSVKRQAASRLPAWPIIATKNTHRQM